MFLTGIPLTRTDNKNTMTDQAKFLTPQQAAARWQVTARSVRRWIDSGEVDGFKVGGRYRIPKEEVKRVESGGKKRESAHA